MKHVINNQLGLVQHMHIHSIKIIQTRLNSQSRGEQ